MACTCRPGCRRALFDLLDPTPRRGLGRAHGRAIVQRRPARHPGCGALGLAGAAAARPVRVRPRADPGALGARAGRSQPRRRRAEPCFTPHVLTLGYARRFAPTSGRSSSSTTRSGWPGFSTTPTARSRSSSPARRTRPTSRRSCTCSAFSTACLDPAFGGRLAFVDDYDMHVAPLPGAGLRRVAQQPAQAARSERHQRHEGGDERRAAPEHRRRMVGRRVTTAVTAG